MWDGSGESESEEERWCVAGMTIFGCVTVWLDDNQWLNMRQKQALKQ